MSKIKVGFSLFSQGQTPVNVGWEMYDYIDDKFKNVSKEVLEQIFYDIKNRADFYIEQNRIQTQTPATKKLINSVKKDIVGEKLKIRVGGPNVPYAGIHNLPEGQTYEIQAKNSKFTRNGVPQLRFHWHRYNVKVTTFSVNRPGTAFFTKAWRDVVYDLDKYYNILLD